MTKYLLKNFTNGWFIGNFTPSLLKTEAFEIAVKEYKMGAIDPIHFHKIAKEFTVVMSGCIQMNDQYFCEGDIVEVHQNEVIDFLAVTDATLFVIKIPSVPNDKYLIQ